MSSHWPAFCQFPNNKVTPTLWFSHWPILGKDRGVWQKIDNTHSSKSIPTVVTRWQNSYKHFKPNLEMRSHPSCAPTNHSVKVAGNSAQTQIDLTQWRWDQIWWNVIQFKIKLNSQCMSEIHFWQKVCKIWDALWSGKPANFSRSKEANFLQQKRVKS